jgi:hypothetical protein
VRARFGRVAGREAFKAMLALHRHHDGRTLVGDTPSAQPRFLLTPRDFAAAVARLETTRAEPPDETAIGEELRWGYSQPPLLSLAQEARAAGLVRVRYDVADGSRRYMRAA